MRFIQAEALLAIGRIEDDAAIRVLLDVAFVDHLG